MKELGLARETTVGRRKLEGPQEVVGLLEVGSNSKDFVDQVVAAVDANRGETLLDNGVLGNGDPLLIDLSETTLVHKVADSLEGGVSIGNIRLNQSEHSHSGLVQLYKDTIVDLAKAEELHDLLSLGADSDDTPDPDHKRKLGLGRDVETTLGLSLAPCLDSISHSGSILSSVLGTISLEDLLVSSTLLRGGDGGLLSGRRNLGSSRLLLLNTLGNLGHFVSVYSGGLRDK